MLFAVVRAVEVYDPITGSKEKLLKVRDMGEKLDWTGDWSASSAKWSLEMKEHLGYADTYREGSHCFFMTFDDYISYFNSTCLVKLHASHSKAVSPFLRETLRLSHGKDSFALAKFHLPYQSDKIYLTVHQVSSHFITGTAYKLSKARILVGQVLPSQELIYTNAANGTTEDLTLELASLPSGDYLVFLQVDWCDPTLISSFVLSSFSD